MKTNQEIVNAFNELPAQQQSNVRRLVDEYTAACELAKGQDPGRSRHWKTRVWDLETDLKERLGIA
jgi:hypothetical protein